MEMYTKRKKYKQEKNPLEYVYKILMNSLYGKFAQRNELKEMGSETDIEKCFDPTLEFVPFSELSDQGYWKKKNQTATEQRAQHDIVIWSAYVTCHARLKLYSYIEKVGFNFAYCDTDSLFTEVKMESSNELGDMKLEYEVQACEFIKPKHYSYIADEKEKKKIKGIKNDSIKNIRDTEQEFLRMTTPLEEIKQTIINPETGERYKAGEFKRIHKKICLTDDKRKHLPNGETLPISIDTDLLGIMVE